jgi:hypothetical protein
MTYKFEKLEVWQMAVEYIDDLSGCRCLAPE